MTGPRNAALSPFRRSDKMDQPLFPDAAAGTLLRHDMKPDRTGWTVYDVIEGRPVCLDELSLVGLDFEDANELVDALNRQDLEIERTARRLVLEAAQKAF